MTANWGKLFAQIDLHRDSAIREFHDINCVELWDHVGTTAAQSHLPLPEYPIATAPAHWEAAAPLRDVWLLPPLHVLRPSSTTRRSHALPVPLCFCAILGEPQDFPVRIRRRWSRGLATSKPIDRIQVQRGDLTGHQVIPLGAIPYTLQIVHLEVQAAGVGAPKGRSLGLTGFDFRRSPLHLVRHHHASALVVISHARDRSNPLYCEDVAVLLCPVPTNHFAAAASLQVSAKAQKHRIHHLGQQIVACQHMETVQPPVDHSGKNRRRKHGLQKASRAIGHTNNLVRSSHCNLATIRTKNWR
mmetsp:Transcript_19451/g.43091  ORF Transcript_19451/g.43091 Transcript_19451/m.43091 type:complete len:301 (-) Transcript_19451:844-1746(-)